MVGPNRTAQENATRRQLGKRKGPVTPGFEITQSWAGLCREILMVHPDLPTWEIVEQIKKRGIKKTIPGILDAIRKARVNLKIETSRSDRKEDTYIIAPVRLTREQYERMTRGGQHIGVVLEKYLENFLNTT